MSRPKARHIFHVVAFVFGAVALGVLIDNLGRDGFEEAILGTGRWFLVLAAIDLTALVCDAAGVYCFVRPLAKVRYLRVFAAQASGLAINRLSPTNSFGEPVKVTMLMAHVPAAAAVSAIVKFNLTTYVTGIATIVIGAPLTLLNLELPAEAVIAVVVITALMVAGLTGMIVLAKRGALGTLIRAARRIRILSEPRAARWTERLAEIDANIRVFGDRATLRAFPFVLASRFLTMSGALVILIATGANLTPALVIGMMSVGQVITWVSNIIPLGLGLADGGNYALYKILGAPPGAGLEFAMINRVRTVVLASMGLVVMVISNVFDRRDSR